MSAYDPLDHIGRITHRTIERAQLTEPSAERHQWFIRHISQTQSWQVADALGIPRKHAVVPE